MQNAFVFSFRLVRNNVFLSHSALHLFLQSKLTVEEIEEYIDSKGDDEPYDTILAESGFKERLLDEDLDFIPRERLPSKPDSGIDTSSHEADETDLTDCGLSLETSLPGDEEQEVFNDGNTADDEDNADVDDDDAHGDDSDMEVEGSMKSLRLSSFPSLPTEAERELESSVEYLLSDSSKSDREANNNRESTRKSSNDAGLTMKANVKKRPKFKKRRKTCIAQFTVPNSSVVESQPSSPNDWRKKANVRRCFSFNTTTRPFLGFMRNSIFNKSTDQDLPSGYASRSSMYRSSSSKLSGSEEKFRSPSKRKISLNEYFIVQRDATKSLEENEFNTSV